MSKLKWFKHYNTAHEGQLFGDLILTGRHEAALLAYIIMELISRFEDESRRGYASVPIDRLARAMNMKPSKIDRLLTEISAVSRSDLVCETDEEQPRNRSFLMRNWLKYQETRGGKRSAKNEQKSGRSKKGEGRSKKKEINTTEAELYPDEFKPLASELVSREVPARLVIKWKELYGAAWVIDEINKALSWELANPNRKAKEFPRFMAGWLSRGWDNKKQKEAQQTHQPQVVGTRLVDLS